MEIICPFCGKEVKSRAISEWSYFPKTVKVRRYLCKCSKKFNFYQGIKKTWTVPKAKQKKIK